MTFRNVLYKALIILTRLILYAVVAQQYKIVIITVLVGGKSSMEVSDDIIIGGERAENPWPAVAPRRATAASESRLYTTFDLATAFPLF